MIEQLQGSGSAGVVTVTKGLDELAVTSAGLKAICTYETAEGSEEVRKTCGGAGYLLSSGVGAIPNNYVWEVTAEGDYNVMLLWLSKYIVQLAQGIASGKRRGEGMFSYMNSLP